MLAKSSLIQKELRSWDGICGAARQQSGGAPPRSGVQRRGPVRATAKLQSRWSIKAGIRAQNRAGQTEDSVTAGRL